MLALWIESGRLIELVLAFVAIEGLAFAIWRRRAKSPPFASQLLANLAAGAMLLLALQAALTDAGWIWVAIWLSFGLAAHVVDLVLRFRCKAC